jgi:hypothetical protein
MGGQELSDGVWSRNEPHLTRNTGDPRRTGRATGLFVEAIMSLRERSHNGGCLRAREKTPNACTETIRLSWRLNAIPQRAIDVRHAG